MRFDLLGFLKEKVLFLPLAPRSLPRKGAFLGEDLFEEPDSLDPEALDIEGFLDSELRGRYKENRDAEWNSDGERYVFLHNELQKIEFMKEYLSYISITGQYAKMNFHPQNKFQPADFAPATLHGFCTKGVSDTNTPVIVEKKGGTVAGVLWKLDESDKNYEMHMLIESHESKCDLGTAEVDSGDGKPTKKPCRVFFHRDEEEGKVMTEQTFDMKRFEREHEEQKATEKNEQELDR